MAGAKFWLINSARIPLESAGLTGIQQERGGTDKTSQLPILTDAHIPISAIQQTKDWHWSLVHLYATPNNISPKNTKHLFFSTLPSPPSLALTSSPHNNQLWLHASCINFCHTFLSDPIPFILLLLYHHYPCSFPFTDIILLNSYKYTSHVPVFSILDIKVVSVLFLCPLISVSQSCYLY